MSCQHYDMGRAMAGASDWMAKMLSRAMAERKAVAVKDKILVDRDGVAYLPVTEVKLKAKDVG